MNKLLIFCVVLLCCGCIHPQPKPTIVSVESWGKVLDAETTSPAFGASAKTIVKCERGVFALRRSYSIPLGKEACLVQMSDGNYWMELEGSMYRTNNPPHSNAEVNHAR